MRISRLYALFLVASLGFAAAGCARATRAASGRTFCPTPTATVYVQNDNWLDVVVYLVRGGARYRLGQVTSFQPAVFQVPAAAIGATNDVYLVVHPIGSRYDYQSPDIMLAPGHTIIDLRVDNIIDHSSVMVALENPEEI
ncbi:MAG: hypothetical protein HY700_13530 [Gemmatimonadetes bacterium]|nr:hypothetical protein [Gemmatimonadota bacterium]